MNTVVNNTESSICKCALCQKFGPLYSSIHNNNDSLIYEHLINSDNKKDVLKKNNIMNIVCIICIILFLLVSSKFKK